MTFTFKQLKKKERYDTFTNKKIVLLLTTALEHAVMYNGDSIEDHIASALGYTGTGFTNDRGEPLYEKRGEEDEC